jgi:hypothetical protein
LRRDVAPFPQAAAPLFAAPLLPARSARGLPIIRIQHLNGSNDFDDFAGTPDPEWIVQPGELLFAIRP